MLRLKGLFEAIAVLLKDAVQGAVVEGTTQGQDGIAIFLVPPGAGAFEADMADEALRGLDSPRADGLAALAMTAVVDLVQPFFQVLEGTVDGHFGVLRSWLHALQSPYHTGSLVAE